MVGLVIHGDKSKIPSIILICTLFSELRISISYKYRPAGISIDTLPGKSNEISPKDAGPTIEQLNE